MFICGQAMYRIRRVRVVKEKTATTTTPIAPAASPASWNALHLVEWEKLRCDGLGRSERLHFRVCYDRDLNALVRIC